MTEQRNALAELFASCWNDDALKDRFLRDPKAVLAERGIDVPSGISVKVVENTDDLVYITIPRAPDSAIELSDQDLASAAAGLPQPRGARSRLVREPDPPKRLGSGAAARPRRWAQRTGLSQCAAVLRGGAAPLHCVQGTRAGLRLAGMRAGAGG